MPTETEIPHYVRECIRTLPPLPAAVQRLLTLTKTPDVDFDQITKVISSDQTLTARVLRAANSSLYGTARRVQTIRQAAIVLGRNAMTNLVLSISALNMKSRLAEQWPGSLTDFWKHNMGVALTARGLAQQLQCSDPEEAFVVGLLHDIGKLIMLEHFGPRYAKLLTADQHKARPLHLMERDQLDTDHATVGRALCLHWKLPNSLTEAVTYHHDEDFSETNSLGALVRSANELVKMIHIGNSGNRFAELHPPQQVLHNLVRSRQLRRLIEELPREVNQAAEVFGTAPRQDAECARDETEERPVVHLLVNLPEEYALLKPVLWSMGYDPVSLSDADGLAPEPTGAAPLAGLVTDVTVSSARQRAYEQRNVPVLNYSVWRRQHNQPGPAYLNTEQFHAWLRQSLRPATAAPSVA